jgi:hypothetical protein
VRKSSSFVLSLCLFAAAVSARAQQQKPHYVFDGTTLQVMEDDLAFAKYKQWQVWLYQEGVRIPRYTAGLQYSRWGLIEGRSSESIVKQLKASQNFERAYVNFFGLGTWGRYTFFNVLGPIAVTDQAVEKNSTALEERYQLEELHRRVSRLIVNAQPSLENNESEGPTSPVKNYFDQIRDALEQICKLYSQLARVRPQLRFISGEIAQTKTVVAQAENSVPKITSTLPSVKLPTSTSWMSHTERAGSDGTIQVEVREAGSAVSVQQTWTGGDGSMTGTVIVTIIPFNDIGSVDLEPPMGNAGNTWTVHVQSARSSFPEAMNSPLRKTGKKVLPAVNLTTTRSAVYFVFLNSAEAQDAYAYFLYHKQLGR